MARAYSLDLRERVIAAVRSGQSRRKAAETFGVEPSTVVKWWLRYRATGEVAARARGGSKVRALVDESEWVLERVAAEPHVRTRALAGGPRRARAGCEPRDGLEFAAPDA